LDEMISACGFRTGPVADNLHTVELYTILSVLTEYRWNRLQGAKNLGISNRGCFHVDGRLRHGSMISARLAQMLLCMLQVNRGRRELAHGLLSHAQGILTMTRTRMKN
jgi:hypothetical protein